MNEPGNAPPHAQEVPIPFEREKWLTETRLREQEFEQKIREQDRFDQELELKREETRLNRRFFTNPLVAAIFAAALAGIANAGVAWYNANEQRVREDSNAAEQKKLEDLRAEANRILEALKSPNIQDTATIKLQRLVDLHLVTTPAILTSITSYLNQSTKNTAVPHVETTAEPVEGPLSEFLRRGTLGIDISQYQVNIDFQNIFKNGVRFIYIKASQGITPNLSTENQISDSQKAGIKIGIYHLYDPRIGVHEQFEYFAKIMQNHSFDLPPALDMADMGSKLPKDVLLEKTKEFSDLIEGRFKVKPILYGGTSTPHPPGFKIWLARYGQTKPPPDEYLIWQFSDNGGGIPALRGLDVNVFRGSIDELVASGKQ